MRNTQEHLRAPDIVMDPRRLGSLQPTRLSASRSLYARMARERWSIDLVRADIDSNGAGVIEYRINAGGFLMTFVAFSYEPTLVDRSPRIIGSSWDFEGALVEGVLSPEELEETRVAIPRLYAGRATPNTLIWFRANRSIRLFEHVVEALTEGKQPEVARIQEVGYLLRNTGLDGNGTFGTKDFQLYGDDHPLGVPYHAQLFTAYMMRELSLDLVNTIARERNPQAVEVDFDTRKSIAVGNGSALGLVLLCMNRPHLVNAWLTGYETLRAEASTLVIDGDVADRLGSMLTESVEYKENDHTDYGVFPSGEAVAVDLKLIRRHLHRGHRQKLTLGDVVDGLPSTTSPEAIELFHAMMLELLPQEQVDARSRQLSVNERKQVDPTQTIADLDRILREQFAWVDDFAEAHPDDKNRLWYKSRNSEEPRSGPVDEVPDLTNDLAVDFLAQIRVLKTAIEEAEGIVRVGALVTRHQHLQQIVGYVQHLAGLAYATPRMDVRDKDFVPAHIIRLFNGFCFGLEKTHDVHQRNLRGVIFEHAHFHRDLERPAHDWRWAVERVA